MNHKYFPLAVWVGPWKTRVKAVYYKDKEIYRNVLKGKWFSSWIYTFLIHCFDECQTQSYSSYHVPLVPYFPHHQVLSVDFVNNGLSVKRFMGLVGSWNLDWVSDAKLQEVTLYLSPSYFIRPVRMIGTQWEFDQGRVCMKGKKISRKLNQ